MKNLSKLPQTLSIQEQKVKLVENDVHLALTVVDTPGNIIWVLQISNWEKFLPEKVYSQKSGHQSAGGVPGVTAV